jgi:4-amino-4-deoxy-L-arabinose transferase-like glycosyltransferase
MDLINHRDVNRSPFQRVTLDRRDTFLAVVLALTVLIAGAARMVVGTCGVYHDDAIYVSTAKALAQGEGYRLINLPGEPPQTKYPVLYPLLLAGIWRVWSSFPENLVAMQGLSLASGALALALAYLLVVRHGYFSRWIAAAAGGICATSPAYLYYSTQTLSEMPFALLVVTAIWALEDHVIQQHHTRRRQFLTGMLLSLPFLCRSIGITLIPAGLLTAYLTTRRIRWLIAGVAVVTLPSVLWPVLAAGGWERDPVQGYYTDYLGWWLAAGLPAMARVFLGNSVYLLDGTARLSFEGLCDLLSSPGSAAAMVICVGIGIVPWLAVLTHLRRGLMLPACLLAYITLVLVWPWPPYRFLIPILPFLVGYFVLGVSTALRILRAPRRRVVVATVCLAGVLAANVTLLCRHRSASGLAKYPFVALPAAPVRWHAFQESFAWLRDHARSDDAVASGLDTMVYLYTNLPSFRPFAQHPGALFYGQDAPPLGTVAQFAKILELRQPRFLVDCPMPGFSEGAPFAELLRQFRSSYPDRLAQVFQSTDRQVRIFELRPDPQPATSIGK